MTNDFQHGICDLSVVPVRAEPSDKSEITTQLMFGDIFTILQQSEDGKWVKIEITYDSYVGWIDAKQYEGVSREYFNEYGKMAWPVCRELVGLVQGHGRVFPVLMGSTLPFYQEGKIIIGKNILKFQGEAFFLNPNHDFKFLENTAKFYLGAPYLWGGKTHFGIDCSGFIQQILKISGFKIYRDARQQEECGRKKEFEDRRPGDLAFFSNAHGKVVHVGLLLENNLIIHASGEVRIDQLDETGIYNKERNLHTHKLYSIRRIID